MLCIVIPTYNSKAHLALLLSQIPNDVRVVVSDGGSDDGTLDVAVSCKALIALGYTGRGVQLGRGVTWALESPWILVLHADSGLPANFMNFILRHIERHPEKAGYFDLKFDSTRGSARIIEGLVRLRCRWFGLPYGDQGLLISRTLYEAVGGYEDFPLFEDVALVQKIGKRRLRRLGVPLLTGAERFEREGYFRRGWRNFHLLRRYLKGESPHDIARDYL